MQKNSGKVSVYVVNFHPFFNDFLGKKPIWILNFSSQLSHRPCGQSVLNKVEIAVLTLMEGFPADILPHTHTT